MNIKIQDKAIEARTNGKDRDFRGFVVALRDLKKGQSFMWKLSSNDRMAISVVSYLFERRFATRKDGDVHRVGRIT